MNTLPPPDPSALAQFAIVALMALAFFAVVAGYCH
jgi:hypothetical protein